MLSSTVFDVARVAALGPVVGGQGLGSLVGSHSGPLALEPLVRLRMFMALEVV